MVKTVTSRGPGTWIKCDQAIQIRISIYDINCPYNVCYSLTITSRIHRNKIGNHIQSDEPKRAAKNNWVRPAAENSTDFAAASANDSENLSRLISIF